MALRDLEDERMPRKRHTAEEIVTKLQARLGHIELYAGKSTG
jgi:hypothetical protein